MPHANPFKDTLSAEQQVELDQRWEEHKEWRREKPRLQEGYNLAINSWAAQEFPNPAYEANKNVDFNFLTAGENPLISNLSSTGAVAGKPYIIGTVVPVQKVRA